MFTRGILGGKTGLPLRDDPAGRFLPWIIALMVYLATLALAGALIAADAGQDWRRALTGGMTVELPPAPAGMAGATAGETDRLLDLLRATPGIATADPLGPNQMRALLEPWLGAGAAIEDLPLPRLIAITLAPDAAPDLAKLRQRIAAVAPDARLDDHGAWLGALLRTARGFEILALLVVILAGSAATWTVVFTTRTRLDAHRRSVELLHLIGAQDAYIARQFQFQALLLGLAGGVVGFAPAALTVFLLGLVTRGAEFGLLPEVALDWQGWAVLACLVPAAAAVAMTTARLVVLRALGKMP
ncbi:MAG: cell division protein FtsX [Alphaproteobacteria bacterium]